MPLSEVDRKPIPTLQHLQQRAASTQNQALSISLTEIHCTVLVLLPPQSCASVAIPPGCSRRRNQTVILGRYFEGFEVKMQDLKDANKSATNPLLKLIMMQESLSCVFHPILFRDYLNAGTRWTEPMMQLLITLWKVTTEWQRFHVIGPNHWSKYYSQDSG